MKKFLFLIIALAAFSYLAFDIMNYKSEPYLMSGEENGYRESYNNQENMTLARNIAVLSGARRVAVIGDKKGVLVGIALPSGTGERGKIRELSEMAAKRVYPKAKIMVEIQTEKAEKIFNLASYLEKGIPDEILKSRATYLLQSD